MIFMWLKAPLYDIITAEFGMASARMKLVSMEILNAVCMI